ncbi:hypothetical protein SAMN05216312_109146 [Cohnella sp. OV330]|uniref:hypothetical protein n=1 Tax=Cohnella sp. OV330 TaxID=1855288 RepID=UPI0008DF3B65|nr:hypothetical protein [Cohnella sp. OV330]SFB47401.1 hypothetical protein SAMN05216312_109146 [Cohnella sp. OV330]
MNGSSKKFKVLVGITAIMLAAAPVSAFAANTTNAAATKITAVSQIVKPIYLSSTSYINLVDVGLSPVDGGQIAAFTLSIYNGSSSALDLSNYWFRLSNLSGSSYSIKTSAADAKLTKVAPNSKTMITLYATVGESAKLSDLIFKVVKFNFNVAGYEQGVGRFTFPKNFSNIVAAGSYKSLYFATTTLNSKVTSSTIAASGDDQLITVNYVYNNIGKKAVTLSKYKYYLATASGIMYEATPSVTEDLTIQPLTRKEFSITATVPSTLAKTGWKLIILKDNGGETAVTLPVGTYNLYFSNGTPTSTVTDSFTYTNTEGTYQYKLTSLLREPWNSQDVLSARIRITNKSTTAVSIPAVSGYFYLDDKTKLEFKTITVNNQFGLNAGSYVDLDVYAKLPSNFNFAKAKLVLNNKVDDKTTTKLGELTGTSYLAQIPNFAVDKVMNVDREGNKMTATLNNVNVYNTTTTKIFSVQMTLTSEEKRTIDPVRLVGLFKSDNGDIFPATATMAEGQVNASNKALLTFTASVPQNYDTNNLKLIVGEGVSDTKYTDSKTAADGFINAVSYSLPQEQRLYSTFKDINLLPYKFTINKFFPTLLGDDIQLTLDYNLDKDTFYNLYPTDRKLVLEVDGINLSDGKVTNYLSQELTIEGDGTTPTLKAGTNQELIIKKANPNTGYDGTLKYRLRLYEVVQGAKKIVADRAIDYWFITNDWTGDTNN